jgi:hypothetical protein
MGRLFYLRAGGSSRAKLDRSNRDESEAVPTLYMIGSMQGVISPNNTLRNRRESVANSPSRNKAGQDRTQEASRPPKIRNLIQG